MDIKETVCDSVDDCIQVLRTEWPYFVSTVINSRVS